MRSRNLVSVVAFLASAGCYPTLPPYLAESTEVLAPKKVGLTFVGAGAGSDTNCCGKGSAVQGMTGIEARVRIGMGAKQELGASFFGGIGTAVTGDPPWAVGGKGTYKIAPLPWFAIVANGGAMTFMVSSIAVLGGDLAVIVAPYTAPNGTQLYTGLKGGFSVPVLQNVQATSESFTLPVGVSIHTSDRVRLIFESGFVIGLSQTHSGSMPGATQDAASPGGYGLFAFAYNFR